MAERFYAVCYGRKPGVYDKWSDVLDQITGYPQPVYKKFSSKDDAETYLESYAPIGTMEVDESSDKFYAVPRGKMIGLFNDFTEVRKHISGHPQPLYKKFDNVADARAYFNKYAKGECSDDKAAGSAQKSSKSHKGKEKAEKKAFYAVARGHQTGVYSTWAECQEQTKDFKGAKFKKFDNEEDANQFAQGKSVEKDSSAKKGKKRSKSTSDQDEGGSEKVKRRKSERIAAK